MPFWRNSLPPEDRNQGFSLKRTPQLGGLAGIITSEEMIVCDTHFWRGRTMPCERVTNSDGKTIDDTQCPACEQKQPWRTHVYLAAIHPKTHEHYIFECTAQAAKPFEEYLQQTGTLRGCHFIAGRAKPTPNAKVVIQTRTANLAQISLPNAPNVPKALAVIWRLPPTAIGLSDSKWDPPQIHTNADILHDVRNQEDDAAGEAEFEKRRATAIEHLHSQLVKGNPRKAEKVPA